MTLVGNVACTRNDKDGHNFSQNVYILCTLHTKMQSHAFKIYRYFSVHFDDISENKKLRMLLNLKIKIVHNTLTEKYFLKEQHLKTS
jgi:hypothetical protein